MMNREEALEYVAQHQWWPNADTEDDMLPHTPAGWDWVIQFGKRVLVHSIHDPITRADCEKAQQTMLSAPATDPAPAPNKYQRKVPSTTIDVYDVLTAYSVTNPATQHAIKKLLQPGNRGHKDTLTDLCEALASIRRAIQIERQSCQQ